MRIQHRRHDAGTAAVAHDTDHRPGVLDAASGSRRHRRAHQSRRRTSSVRAGGGRAASNYGIPRSDTAPSSPSVIHRANASGTSRAVAGTDRMHEAQMPRERDDVEADAAPGFSSSGRGAEVIEPRQRHSSARRRSDVTTRRSSTKRIMAFPPARLSCTVAARSQRRM